MTDSVHESLWRTTWRMVVSPRVAMADLERDPEAGRKGLILALVLGTASTILAAIQRHYGYPVADPPISVEDPLAILVWSAVPLSVAGLAVAAALLRRLTDGGPFGVAFGRVSFALGVPSVIVLVEMVAVVVALTSGTDPADATTWLADDESPVYWATSLFSLVWAIVLLVLGTRASGATGCLSTGLVTVLVLLASLVPGGLVFIAIFV